MKSSQSPKKHVIGCWIRLIINSVYTKKKKCQSDHWVWGPQKAYSKTYIIHGHGPAGFAVGEAKEVLWAKFLVNKFNYRQIGSK